MNELLIAVTVIVELILLLLRTIARRFYGIDSAEPTLSVTEWNAQPMSWRKYLCGSKVNKGVEKPPKIKNTSSGVL